jgi:hypothetical protein
MRGAAPGPNRRAPALALALALVAAVLGASPGRAAASSGIVPDHLKLQLAGDVGFLSPGAGYGWFGRRLEADLFLGWVPAAIDGADVFSITPKVTWAPLRLDAGRGWEVRPVTAALQLTYTFGHDYYLLLPERFPANYYDFATALRVGFAIGAEVARTLRGTRRVGVYAELVALDALVLAWVRNPRTLGPTNVFTLAIGARLEL